SAALEGVAGDGRVWAGGSGPRYVDAAGREGDCGRGGGGGHVGGGERVAGGAGGAGDARMVDGRHPVLVRRADLEGEVLVGGGARACVRRDHEPLASAAAALEAVPLHGCGFHAVWSGPGDGEARDAGVCDRGGGGRG